MPPTFSNGKICYIEQTDIARSAAFYSQVFGWKTRQRFVIYVMVDSVCATMDKLVSSGGEIHG
jgi:predicted enzyme related to lactoylglutathione lyase